MAKINWKPGTMVYPVPPALISCGSVEQPNVMTAAWTGIINSEPPMTYVSIWPSRYSHEIISQTREFNLPTLKLVTATDFCGVKSGRDIDKFKEADLTPLPCAQVKAPQIAECPVSVECKVTEIKPLGSHDMFVAEIVGVDVDDQYLDDAGKLWLEKAGLLAFVHGHYFTLGRVLGSFGFSVNKNRLAMMKKMEKVEVSVKEPKAILEKRAEKEARPMSRDSKFAKKRRPLAPHSSAPAQNKFSGKAKFAKHKNAAPAKSFAKERNAATARSHAK